MTTIDLSKIQITALDGTVQEHDFSKDLAQAIFQNTQLISEHNFAIELFKNPIVELTTENEGIIVSFTERYFKACVQIAIKKLIS